LALRIEGIPEAATMPGIGPLHLILICIDDLERLSRGFGYVNNPTCTDGRWCGYGGYRVGGLAGSARLCDAFLTNL
jgi:hypothetical protein